jgi:hypothetical protein
MGLWSAFGYITMHTTGAYAFLTVFVAQLGTGHSSNTHIFVCLLFYQSSSNMLQKCTSSVLAVWLKSHKTRNPRNTSDWRNVQVMSSSHVASKHPLDKTLHYLISTIRICIPSYWMWLTIKTCARVKLRRSVNGFLKDSRRRQRSVDGISLVTTKGSLTDGYYCIRASLRQDAAEDPAADCCSCKGPGSAMSVRRQSRTFRKIQPYLGAFGTITLLRQLAWLSFKLQGLFLAIAWMLGNFGLGYSTVPFALQGPLHRFRWGWVMSNWHSLNFMLLVGTGSGKLQTH